MNEDKICIEEIAEYVKELLLNRIKSGDIDNSSLISLMPWVAPRLVSEEKQRVEIIHKFEVVKPQLDHSQQENVATLTSLESGEEELEDVDEENGESAT